jgi:hypothetical protein
VRVVFAALWLCLPAWGKPGAGTLSDPILVDDFPYIVAGDTTGGSHELDGYSCAAQNESGGERVYRFTLSAPAKVSAWLQAASPVDVDIHLLTDATTSGATAATCVARGDVIAEAQMPAGTHYLVVDSYTSDAKAGPYVLHLDAVGDAWVTRPLGSGVSWRSRRFLGAGGGPQVVHELVVSDLAAVSVRALHASGCQTVAQIGQAAGAIAGINGGYFDTAAAGCAPVSLLKASGVLVAKNPSVSMRGAFGLTPSPSPSPLVALVGGNVDWPAAFEAHGAGPILVQGGAPHIGSAAWASEGFSSSSFLGLNPRTFAGFDAAGAVHLGTVDGRRTTTTALGMSMDALASFVTSAEIGLEDGVNLDGGGSSTMWIAGATPNGVVNYPSDAGSTEDATHPSARGVSGGWFVFAPPYNHPPRFQTQPPADAAVGTPYVYDADALDLDIADVLTFSLEAPPPGVTVDATTGVVTFLPAADDLPTRTLTLVVSDGHGGEARQSWLVTLAGAQGVPDDGGTVAADDAGPSAPDLAMARGGSDLSSGCDVTSSRAGGAWILLLLLFARRRYA